MKTTGSTSILFVVVPGWTSKLRDNQKSTFVRKCHEIRPVDKNSLAHDSASQFCSNVMCVFSRMEVSFWRRCILGSSRTTMNVFSLARVGGTTGRFINMELIKRLKFPDFKCHQPVSRMVKRSSRSITRQFMCHMAFGWL